MRRMGVWATLNLSARFVQIPERKASHVSERWEVERPGLFKEPGKLCIINNPSPKFTLSALIRKLLCGRLILLHVLGLEIHLCYHSTASGSGYKVGELPGAVYECGSFASGSFPGLASANYIVFCSWKPQRSCKTFLIKQHLSHMGKRSPFRPRSRLSAIGCTM